MWEVMSELREGQKKDGWIVVLSKAERTNPSLEFLAAVFVYISLPRELTRRPETPVLFPRVYSSFVLPPRAFLPALL